MANSHRRAAHRELEAAKALGTARVRRRGRFDSAPDVRPVTIAGVQFVAEVKTRKALPVLLTRAIEQAQRYLPGAAPMVVFSQTGARAFVVLSLESFRAVAGLAPVEPVTQPLLPFGGRNG